jgi:D-glycero-D-manno-heptose 1,7-bisphosphate phosphatase
VQKIKNMGYLAIVATNQPDIAPAELAAMHNKLKQELAIDDIYVCSHLDPDNCSCRKPKAGMLLDAADKHDIDLPRSFMVGDWWRDIDAGKTAGTKTILVSMPSNDRILHYDYLAKDLTHAGKIIEAHKNDSPKIVTHPNEKIESSLV